MLGFARLMDRVSDFFARICAVFIFASAMISAGNAILRYAFGLSSNAWTEIQWHLFGAAVMLGAAQVLRLNEHVRVDVLYGQLSNRKKAMIDITGMIVFMIGMCVVNLWLSWPFFYQKFVGGEMSGNAGGLILWPIAMMLPMGFALLGLQGVAEVIKRVAWLRGQYDMDLHYEKPVQ